MTQVRTGSIDQRHRNQEKENHYVVDNFDVGTCTRSCPQCTATPTELVQHDAHQQEQQHEDNDLKIKGRGTRVMTKTTSEAHTQNHIPGWQSVLFNMLS